MMPSKVDVRSLEQLLLRQIQLEQISISEVQAVTCAHELNRDMVPNRDAAFGPRIIHAIIVRIYPAGICSLCQPCDYQPVKRLRTYQE
jgi:hypothetical protein